MTRRVVLIGATGEFGSRLAKLLAGLDGISLFLTAREARRAEGLAAALKPGARCASITGMAFERRDAEAAFAALRPWLVVDASGPFQGMDYATARSAIDSGAHWIDLADAEDYLLGFAGALDAPSRASRVSATAGASSTPALSFAVVDDLTRDWRRVDTVDLAIYPAGNAPVGQAVIEAVLSYAGRPVSVWREGRRQTVTGWGKMAGVTVPGLGKRYRSPVATADWHILSSRFAVTTRVAFYAGLGARLEHFGLVALAWLAARGWTGDLKPMAGLLMQGRRLTRRFASDAGAMTVDVSGIDGEGAQAVAHWWLIAERGDGPKVPVLAAMALTRRLLDGDFHVGARMAAGAASLAEIEAEMHAFALRTDRNVETAAPITPENARVGA